MRPGSPAEKLWDDDPERACTSLAKRLLEPPQLFKFTTHTHTQPTDRNKVFVSRGPFTERQLGSVSFQDPDYDAHAPRPAVGPIQFPLDCSTQQAVSNEAEKQAEEKKQKEPRDLSPYLLVENPGRCWTVSTSANPPPEGNFPVVLYKHCIKQVFEV